MENLPLVRIAALVPEFAAKDLPLGRTHYDYLYRGTRIQRMFATLNYLLKILYFLGQSFADRLEDHMRPNGQLLDRS